MEHMQRAASVSCITNIDLFFSNRITFINLSPFNMKNLVTNKSRAWLECKELGKTLLKVAFSLTLLQYFFFLIS